MWLKDHKAYLSKETIAQKDLEPYSEAISFIQAWVAIIIQARELPLSPKA